MDCPEGHLKDPDDSRKDEPHPVLWGVDDKEYKVGPVEVVSVPEDLEVAPPSDEWERADKHDGENNHQCHTSWIGCARNQTKNVWFCAEDPLGHGPWLGPDGAVASLTHPGASVCIGTFIFLSWERVVWTYGSFVVFLLSKSAPAYIAA